MVSYSNINLSKNKLEVNIVAADALIIDRTKLRYYLEIYVPDGYLSSTFKKLVRLEGSEVPPYNVSGTTVYEGAYFPVADYLDTMLDYTAPKFNQNVVSQCENLTLQYYFKKIIENDSIQIFTETTPIDTILKGGIDDKDFPKWGGMVFSNSLGLAGKFMTWMPNEKLIQEHQQEYLYWINNVAGGVATANVKCQIKYSDGTTLDKQLFSIASPAAFGVYCIPIGSDIVSIQNETKDVLGYSIWLENSGQEITEKRTFVIDRRYRRYVKNILFSNSLSVFDTLTVFGQGTETLNVIREEFEHYVPFAAQATYAETIINKVTGERQIEITTGFIDDNELDYLQDLMFAKQVYLITDRELIPLINISPVYVNREDDVFVRGRKFLFKYANLEYSYSKLVPPPFMAQRPITWQAIGVAKCLSNTNGIRTGLGQYPKLKKIYADSGLEVVPVVIKNNTMGTEGYIGPVVVNGCEITPFLSAEYSAQLAFTKNDCVGDSTGTRPIYTIPAKRYGSDTSQAEADAKALADFVGMNNQAGANAVGVCRTLAWRGYGMPVCVQNNNGVYTGIGSYPQLERYYTDTNEAFVPSLIKDNTLGTSGYIAPATLSSCAITPYLNVAISRQGTLRRNDCAPGYGGSKALITINAGLYGSVISQADADAKAEAAFVAIDTQAYANANGTCSVNWITGKLKAEWWPIPMLSIPALTSPSAAPDLVTEYQLSDIYDSANGDSVPYGGSEAFLAKISGQVKFDSTETKGWNMLNVDNGVRAKLGGVAMSAGWIDHGFDYTPTAANEWLDFELMFFNDGGPYKLSNQIWDPGFVPANVQIRYNAAL